MVRGCQGWWYSHSVWVTWWFSVDIRVFYFLSSSSFFFLKQDLIQYNLATIYPPASTSQVLRFPIWATMPDCLHFNSIPLTLSLYVMNKDLFLLYTSVHDQYELVDQSQVDLTLCLLVVMEITQLLGTCLLGVSELLEGVRPEENMPCDRRCTGLNWNLSCLVGPCLGIRSCTQSCKRRCP